MLTRDLIEYVKSYGCRVLHIASDVYKEDCLCIEGTNGLIENVNLDQLKELFIP